MKFKFISYGYKYYEEQEVSAPQHDFLFNLRDLANPFWVPELKPLTGLDDKIIEFFTKDEKIQTRLQKIADLMIDFIDDALTNSFKYEDKTHIVAFRCTGGKHRSVYFAEKLYEIVKEHYASKIANEQLAEMFSVEHVDLPRYAEAK
jgi:UPF0042 nucleotide-binding protein